MVNNNQGFSLIEILTACLLFSLVIIGCFYVMHAGFSLNEQLISSVIALNDADSVLEKMRNIDPLDAANLAALYPDGAVLTGFNNLANETVTVRYEDLNDDPIKVYVIVNWQAQGGRVLREELVTCMTMR